VDVNARDAEGRSAFAKALQRRSLDLAAVLLASSAGATEDPSTTVFIPPAKMLN
jgi:hypothetical protein